MEEGTRKRCCLQGRDRQTTRQFCKRRGHHRRRAQLLKDVFTLPPDTGTEVINALLTDTGKALTANQQVIIDQTTTWMQTITDTFAGKEGFPAVGYTAAKTTRDDFIKGDSEKTKKKVARAVRSSPQERQGKG